MARMTKAVVSALCLSLIAMPGLEAQQVSVIAPSILRDKDQGVSVPVPGKVSPTTPARQARPDSSDKIHEGKIENRYVIPSKTSIWQKYYENGIKSLQCRKLEHAERMLLGAIKSSKTPGKNAARHLVLSRLALARLYLYEERFPEALELFRMTLRKVRSSFGEGSLQMAECKYGLARCELELGDRAVAKSHIEEAIEIIKDEKSTDSQLFGQVLQTLGLVLARFGWHEDAEKVFESAHILMKKYPGFKQLDLAQALREQALFYHSQGLRRKSTQLYETSYRIKESFVLSDKPPHVVGQVSFSWEPGSTRAREIIDNEFPFRYVTAKGIRVAATVIDLWELLGVLVTVTNTADHQREFKLGKVVLTRVNTNRPLKLRSAIIPPVDPNSIDRVQKELSMWALTHTRPWLANIQKTRTVRGLVPPNGHDMFRGPNVFGVYGKWKAISHTVPRKVGVLPSREAVLAARQEDDVDLPGLLMSGNFKVKGLVPVWLEPFESRTGELFYLNPRDTDIEIRVPVGNAIFKLPFHTRKKYSH